MVQTLARCQSCGLPGGVAESLTWRANGTVILRRTRGLRVALLDQETMNGILSALEAEIGAGACWRAVRDATRFVTGKSLAGLKGKLSRYGVVKKRALEALEVNSVLLGMGRIEVEKFTPGEGGMMLLRSPFAIDIATAGITGVLEEIDHCPYRYELQPQGANTFKLRLALADADDYEARTQQDIPFFSRAVGGGEKEDTCRQCGAPSSIAELRWDELYGTIEAGLGGRRVAFIPSFILVALSHLETGEGGVDVRKSVEEAAYTSTMKSLEGGTTDAYEDDGMLAREEGGRGAWARTRARGWGAAAEERLGAEGWRVTMLNPVDNALIAGWLRALYTVAEGREMRMDVKEEPAQSSFEIN